MSNPSINGNGNVPAWNYPLSNAQGQAPGQSSPTIFVTPSVDSTSFTAGLPTGGAQPVDASSPNTPSPSSNWYQDWFNQWNSTMSSLNSTIQNGAAPMDVAPSTVSPSNYSASYGYIPNYTSTSAGAAPMDAGDTAPVQNPTTDPTVVSTDLNIPEANNGASGPLNVSLGTKMDSSGQLSGQNATISANATGLTGSISSNDGSISNTITLQASDPNSGGNKIAIAVDANDTINTQRDGWTAKKNSDGTITLSQGTGDKANTYTITPQKGTKVLVNGKDVNSDSLFDSDDSSANANGIKTGNPGDDPSDADTLYAQLNGKSSADIAQIDMSGNVQLSNDQKKIVAQQYALAYTKEQLGSQGATIQVGDLTADQVQKASDALNSSNPDLVAALSALKQTVTPDTTTPDDMTNKLQAGQVKITDQNYTQIDFDKIMQLPKGPREQAIRNLNLSGLSQAHKDYLAAKFVVASNKQGQNFIKDNGFGTGDEKFDDDTLADVDLSAVSNAAKFFNQPDLAKSIDKIHDNRDGIAKSVGKSTFGDGHFLSRSDLDEVASNLKDNNTTLDQVINPQ